MACRSIFAAHTEWNHGGLFSGGTVHTVFCFWDIRVKQYKSHILINPVCRQIYSPSCLWWHWFWPVHQLTYQWACVTLWPSRGCKIPTLARSYYNHKVATMVLFELSFSSEICSDSTYPTLRVQASLYRQRLVTGQRSGGWLQAPLGWRGLGGLLVVPPFYNSNTLTESNMLKDSIYEYLAGLLAWWMIHL
jgi:hypothetical protein